MSSYLTDEFENNDQGDLLAAVGCGDLDTVQLLMGALRCSPELREKIMWQAGYDGFPSMSYYLLSLFEDYSIKPYRNGQLMKALDKQNFPKIARLVSLDADLYQSEHTALYTPVVSGDLEMAGYLITLGVDPNKAFTEEDMEDFITFGEVLISKEALTWLTHAREKFVGVNHSTSPQDIAASRKHSL